MGAITLKQAAAWCGGIVEEKYAGVTFLGAGNDTRTLEPGQLFVALQGARDGHDFIPAAMEKGAAAVLCSRRVGDYPAIVVEDPRIALGKIAREEVRRIGMKVVAVTGSVGKSTTKEMIARVLESTYVTCRTPANHNNDIGMPIAILAMGEDTQVAVLEMGMNHFREIAYLSRIAMPDMAVIVNIGTSHMEFLGSQEGIRKAKMEILEGMEPQGSLFLNGDDVMLRNLPQLPVQRITYFGTGEDCRVRGTDIRQEPGKTCFTLEWDGKKCPVELELEGRHYVNDALAAAAVGLAMGVPGEKIGESLKTFRNLAGRQETFEAQGFTIIRDCYNAGPESMAAALAVLGARKGRRIAVLGDMLELGVCTQAEHYRIGRISAENADLLFAFGPNADRVASGALTGGMPRENIGSYTDRDALTAELKRAARPGDVLLFKGSRGMRMEQILDAFLSKDTEDAAK